MAGKKRKGQKLIRELEDFVEDFKRDLEKFWEENEGSLHIEAWMGHTDSRRWLEDLDRATEEIQYLKKRFALSKEKELDEIARDIS